MKNAAALFNCIVLLFVTNAFAAETGDARRSDADLVATSRVLLAMPLLPATLANVLTLTSAAPQPKEAVAPRHMQMMLMPDDGMIIVARVNATGDVETTCVSTPEAGETFIRGARPAARVEQH
jgi:hypothetical protein